MRFPESEVAEPVNLPRPRGAGYAPLRAELAEINFVLLPRYAKPGHEKGQKRWIGLQNPRGERDQIWLSAFAFTESSAIANWLVGMGAE